MSQFDAQTVNLQGLNLIEASAGTGKTYTLAELYLRLIIEKSLAVKQILVVTYTRAATEELRDRLRKKLVQARDDLARPVAEREVLTDLQDNAAITQARHQLLTAIQHFDEASIYTIHGFCQRVLSDFAFECGYLFDLELMGDDLQIVQSAVDDFWRRHITIHDDRLFIGYLLRKKQSPDALLRSIKNYIGKPYLHYLPVKETESEKITNQIEQHFEALKQCWQQEKQQVTDFLYQEGQLKKNMYKPENITGWLQQLDSFLASQRLPAALFEKFEKFTEPELTKALLKGKRLPALKFWAMCEQLQVYYHALQQSHDTRLQQLRWRLLQDLNTQLPLLKRQQGVQSYDDLLVNLEQALNGEEGDALVSQLRERYPAALIDEFQDTDPVQYACFNRIYSESGLATFLVGDPKQAIYSFRGADIFTYLKAKSQAEHEYTLMKNWRSQPELVQAVNQLFSRKNAAFVYQDIPFIAVEAQREKTDLLIEDETCDAAFHINWIDGKNLTKKQMTQYSAGDTANRIAHYLNLAQQNKATLYDEEKQLHRAVQGSDIAILVRSYHQAQAVMAQLQQRGINSVQQGRESVYASLQASILLRILIAIAEYNNEQLITAALVTPVWAVSAEALLQLKQDEYVWQQQVNLFYELHQQWRQEGFMPMFRHMLIESHAHHNLLHHAAGERWLTNLNHLAELIQQHCPHHDHPETVINWLNKHMQLAEEGNTSDESAQIRLESDEQLVRIITIHKSKGLEYPIVFCPFLWDVKKNVQQAELISFYDAESEKIKLAFSEPERSMAKEKARQEAQAEDLRLLYVALTRARERCIVTWGEVKGIEESALFSLLHPEQTDADSDEMMADLAALAEQTPASFSVGKCDTHFRTYEAAALPLLDKLEARQFSGDIQPPWRIGSFSSLTQGYDIDSPDYDVTENEKWMRQIEDISEVDDARFTFPRGAQAGTCLHAILELLDFSCNERSTMENIIEQNVLKYGFDKKWTSGVCQWISEILFTPLDGHGLTLAGLPPRHCLNELAFYFPVTQISVSGLQKACQPYLADNPLLKVLLKRLHFIRFAGFMKGFIDLVFEYEGRFYIVDYKSNFLGAAPEDYQIESVTNAMITHDYPLQYLIYYLALHRYLQLRLPDYNPEQHLGGVYYLFLRGMKHQWGRAGIFYDKPDIALIQALDQYLRGIEYD